MLINPGFATNKAEKQIPYALKKITDLRKLVDEEGLTLDIQVDGRVSLATIPDLLTAGATNLVLGSTSLFIAENTLTKNRELLTDAINKAVLVN